MFIFGEIGLLNAFFFAAVMRDFQKAGYFKDNNYNYRGYLLPYTTFVAYLSKRRLNTRFCRLSLFLRQSP